MAAKATGLCSAILAVLLNGTTYANVMENASGSPLTSLYLSLHTASPGASGNQTTSEAAYTGYARQAIARTSAGFTVSGASATLTSAVNFPACTGGSETETFFALGESLSGVGVLWYFGPISPNIVVSSGVTPQLTTATQITES